MDMYALLPLISLIINLSLGFVILYINPKKRLNQLFSLFTFSLAFLSFANINLFNASTVSEAIFWNKLETVGMVFSTIFMVHFILIYCEKRIIKQKIFLISLYLLGLFFIIIEYASNLITETMYPSYWGYALTPGAFHFSFSLYITISILMGLIALFSYYKKTNSNRKKQQISTLIIGLSIPLLGGILSQLLPLYAGIDIIPLTASLTTITAVFIFYSIYKQSLGLPMSFSIQKKMLSVFFIFILLFSLATFISTDIVATENIEEDVDKNLLSLARSRSNHIETFLSAQKGIVEQLADIQKIQRLLLSNETSADFSLRREEVTEKLLQKSSINPDIIHINVLNSDGIIISSTNSNLVHANKNQSDFFFSSMNGLTFIKDLHYPCEGGDIPVYGISTPVLDGNKPIGLVLVRFSIDPLYDIITDTSGLGKTGEVNLINQNGLMISPSRFYNFSENINQIILHEKIQIAAFNEHIFLDESSKNSSLVHPWGSQEFQDYRGVTCIGTTVYIPKMKWTLLAKIDETEAYETIASIHKILFLAISIISVFSLILAFFISNELSRPIKKLEGYAKEITNGNLYTTSDVQTSDEIGSLSNSLNLMVESLRDQNENLEMKVNERTNELQEKIQELEDFKKVTVGREMRIIELKNELKELKHINQIEEGEPFA